MKYFDTGLSHAPERLSDHVGDYGGPRRSRWPTLRAPPSSEFLFKG
jgi:hypothetical protein